MAFYVGQKVVCIVGFTRLARGRDETFPIKGEVYTIREIKLDSGGDTCLRLQEIVNTPRYYAEGFTEMAFDAELFRPLVEKGTDTGMAILKEIVRTQKTPALNPKQPAEVV